jgi:hypothetical protein
VSGSIERGVYFDAWFPRQHNYHPSFPPRRLRMIDDLEDYRATMLVWAAMGGGAISLPYLEEEAWGEVPARFRFYGFVNDSEFMAECGRRGIKVFGVVFEHAWEFPVELNDEEDRVLSLNEPLGVGHRDWLGMREFWQDRYPSLWPPREKYFPQPVLNALGDEVTDILEECAQRDIFGEPCHALWIECPDREHWNYMMDRNNAVWREYLKAVVRIQIDAGVQGVHFDESEVPITSLQYGGCFCDTCMRGFREYLQQLPEAAAELAGTDLSAFHYGSWLLERGYDFKSGREDTPLFWDYMRFQRRNIVTYFGELARYARDYATSVGREVKISGNFFNLFDHYYAMEPEVDVIVTEMRNTLYRQPAWYRYAAGFGREKPVVVVENPYGGVVPEMVEKLKRGAGYDRFRLSLYEAAALGVNMSVPYGAWMGSVIQDAFWPPHELAVEIQTFLGDHEELFARRSLSEVAVIFGVESNFELIARRDLMQDNRMNVAGEQRVPFWEVCEALSSAAQPYDVVFFPDGTLRADDLELPALTRYAVVVAPDLRSVTDRQAELLRGYIEAGGRLMMLGAFANTIGEAERTGIIGSSGSIGIDDPFGFSLERLPEGPQVHVLSGGPADLVVTVRDLENGAALHLLRYDYDEAADHVPPLEELQLTVRLPFSPTAVEAFDPAGSFQARLDGVENGIAKLVLRRVPLYSIVVLRR